MLVIFCHLKEAAFGQDICTIGIEREGNQSDMHDSFNTEIVSTRVALNRFRMPFEGCSIEVKKKCLPLWGVLSSAVEPQLIALIPIDLVVCIFLECC